MRKINIQGGTDFIYLYLDPLECQEPVQNGIQLSKIQKKKKGFWTFWAILSVFSLHFPKTFERAPYVTTTEIPLDTVCLNKT